MYAMIAPATISLASMRASLPRFGIAMLLACALPALQARAAEAPAPPAGVLDECSAFSQAGMRDCLAQKLAESSAALKQAEGEFADALAKWDEDAKYIKLASASFKTANAAFRKYSESQCALKSALGGGAAGNALALRRLACAVELNAARIDDLKRTAASLPAR